MAIAITFFLLYIAILLTVLTVRLSKFFLKNADTTVSRFNPHVGTVSDLTMKAALKIAYPTQKAKGSIFIPPSEEEEERQRIIDERSAKGLDTPVDLLREKPNEEN